MGVVVLAMKTDQVSPWMQVAPFKPRLKSELVGAIQRHAGKDWYVISDPLSGNHYRFSMAAHRLMAAMDGRRSVAELCASVCDPQGDLDQQRHTLLRLLARMHAAELLDWNLPPATRALMEQLSGTSASGGAARRVLNPLAIRLPLIDPDAWLTRSLPWVKTLFTPFMLVVWCVLVGWGLLQAGLHWPELSGGLTDRVLNTSNLALLWLSYPLVKLLHELGHAFAVKVRGGEVHEMGIILLALVPVPYVDATAANAFPERRWRVLVSAAGVAVDLAVASLALQLWLVVEPGGLLHALCYNVMLITALSTLLFNVNPLMRFDGYYVFSDLIGIPNLATRATRYLLYLVQRVAFGVKTLRSPAHSRFEAIWFMVYGPGAFLYRVFVLALILWFVSDRYLLLGLIIAVWGMGMIVLGPLWKGLQSLLFGPLLAPVRPRALMVSGMFTLGAFLLVFVVPAPSWTQVDAVVWLPEKAVVRAGADGFVQALLAAPGSRVKKGTPLMRNEDPLAGARLARLEAQVRELRARYTALRRQDPAEAARVRDALNSAEADLARAQEEYGRLVAYSGADGHFQPRYGEDLQGRFVHKGEVIGYVTGTVRPRLRAVVMQDDIGRVQSDVRRLVARLVEHSAALVPVRLTNMVPAASYQLPSAVLGTAAGGDVPVDPADSSGRTSLARVFEVELALPPGINAHPGARAQVRFEHSRAPLGIRWYRQLKQKIDRRLTG